MVVSPIKRCNQPACERLSRGGGDGGGGGIICFSSIFLFSFLRVPHGSLLVSSGAAGTTQPAGHHM